MTAALAALIGRPLLIFFVAGLWALAAAALPPIRRALVANSIGWLGFACWEGLVQALTPEANIRVDLLLIGPVLAGLAVWVLLALLRRLSR